MEMSGSQRMTQQMTLSPQMIQALNILAMPMDQLRERIYEEVEQNPALTVVKDNSYAFGSDGDKHQKYLESIPQPEETLQQYLESQLSEHDVPPDVRELAEKIIGNLDSKGYFIVPCEELLSETESRVLLRRTLRILRMFEPAGIFCSTLQESLLLQTERKGPVHPLVKALLTDYFQLLEKNKPQIILSGLKKLNPVLASRYSADDVESAVAFIRSLDPYPAASFVSSSDVRYVSPDAFIRPSTVEEEENGSGPFCIEMLNGTLPEIQVSEDFKSYAEGNGPERSFVRDAVRKADVFISAVQQRSQNMHAVLQVIIGKQSLFFRKGPGNLVPLRMADVAEAAGISESTVSRIANGKYIRCEWGMFEIRYFFTNSIAADGEGPSKEKVKQEISRIIEKHEAAGSGKKLSDEKISQELARRGINLARRTVAKYRSELSIKSSFDRS